MFASVKNPTTALVARLASDLLKEGIQLRAAADVIVMRLAEELTPRLRGDLFARFGSSSIAGDGVHRLHVPSGFGIEYSE